MIRFYATKQLVRLNKVDDDTTITEYAESMNDGSLHYRIYENDVLQRDVILIQAVQNEKNPL